jgi:GNAT superfamily N-acetyltransferase
MSTMEIGPLTVETHPRQEDAPYLDERLYEYNAAQTGVDDGQWLTIFVRDVHQHLCAGIKGWTWCGSSYTSALWMEERLRGQGVGTQLLQAAEQDARARGCQYMVLDSYNVQAPGVYQQHGYEVCAVLEDHPRHHRNYLRKRLL